MNTCSSRLPWSQLSDEERWLRIYDDRRRAREGLPSALPEARRLVLPMLPLMDAIVRSRGSYELREDVVKGVATHIAKCSERLKGSHRDRLSREGDDLTARCRRVVSDLDQYIYAASAAVVRAADERMFPADSPGGLAALALKMDVEGSGEATSDHAAAAGRVFDLIVRSGG